MPNNTNESNVAANRFVGRRLEDKEHKKHFLLVEGSAPRFTLNAFYDNRGPVSVDVFWADQSLTVQRQQEYVEAMRIVCVDEGPAIVGWALCKAGPLQKAEHMVSAVVHTPIETNKNHADIRRRSWYEPQNEQDPERSGKTKAFAMLLAEFFNTNGSMLNVPPAPMASEVTAPVE